MDQPTIALLAADAAPRTQPTSYPEPYATQMAGRIKQSLGELFGLKNFGVNRCTLPPGGVSALLHRHSRQDEFIYVLEGVATLITDHGMAEVSAGMCAGFAAGGAAHRLENRSAHQVVLLEIGDRSAGDEVLYPADDLQVTEGADGIWRYSHKDGRPY